MTTSTRTYGYFKVTRTNEFVSFGDFGVYDSKGRAIGYVYTTATCDFDAGVNTRAPGRELESADVANGRRFSLWCNAQRAGENFGASQRVRLFDTAEARDAALETYLAGARRRAHRTAGVEMLVP